MMPERVSLVYGYDPFQQSLAFLPEDVAVEMAAEVQAVAEAGTYGEVRAVPIKHSCRPIDEDGDEGDDEAFDAAMSDAHGAGDWPPMPTQYALDYSLFRPELVKTLGKVVRTPLNGHYLEIAPDREAEVIALLAREGFTCRRDDALVLRCGLIGEALETALRDVER